MKLYHGSTVAVRKPSLRPGRPNADFGKGFYTTGNLEQAVRWAHIKQEREDAAYAVVSVYEFDEALIDNPDWHVRRFTGADEPWLYFVADCRKSRKHEYDLVQGPVANDKVFTTVNLFESGVLGAEAAILQLKAYKTYDQLSFHTTKTLGTLWFLEAIICSLAKTHSNMEEESQRMQDSTVEYGRIRDDSAQIDMPRKVSVLPDLIGHLKGIDGSLERGREER